MRTGPLMKAPRQYLARGATAEGNVSGAEDRGAMDWCTWCTHAHAHALLSHRVRARGLEVLARAEEEHEGANVEEGIEAAGHGEARVAALSRASARAVHVLVHVHVHVHVRVHVCTEPV